MKTHPELFKFTKTPKSKRNSRAREGFFFTSFKKERSSSFDFFMGSSQELKTTTL
jgi:hypothetical protein